MSHLDPGPLTFTVDVTLTSAGLRARASGRLVAGDGAEPEAWLRLNAIGRGCPMILDVTGVTALDAAGVGRLGRVRQQLAYRDVALQVITSEPDTLRALQLAGVTSVPGAGPEALANTSAGTPVALCA